MKLISYFFLFILIFINLYADDSKLLSDTETDIRNAKTQLMKWDKTKLESDLDQALDFLKMARNNISKVEDLESQRFLDLNKELMMLTFWSNKSKRVFDVAHSKLEIDPFTKPIEEFTAVKKAKTNDKSNTSENNKTEENSNSSKSSISIDILNIEIPNEHPIITKAFQKAVELYKQSPNQLYECEFAFHDIYYDFPTSKTGILAKQIADDFGNKIEAHIQYTIKSRENIISMIPNYQQLCQNKTYDTIIDKLSEMNANEKNNEKREILWEMKEEFSYLKIGINAINDLLQIKKFDPPPASIIGANIRGFIVGSEDRGLIVSSSISSKEHMIIPWVRISDQQIGKLLAIISKNEGISYKIPIAIHLFGYTQEAFQILYERSLDNPTIMAKYSRFYFQTLFYFRKQINLYVDNQIQNAQKLYNNKNLSGAISLLTKSLLEINKNYYLRDQVTKIHTIMATFNN